MNDEMARGWRAASQAALLILDGGRPSIIASFADCAVATENGRIVEMRLNLVIRRRGKIRRPIARMLSSSQKGISPTRPDVRSSMEASPGTELLAIGHISRTQLSFGIAKLVSRRRSVSGNHDKNQQKVTQLDDDGAGYSAKKRRAERSAGQVRPGDHNRQSEQHADDELW
ncbi:hypothetical protein NKH73_00170 [Mesorhizobium sp. M0938]|uniref:hypothetical protein n=1 Tax=unclassified Mesorhizobium TaxID=325217 RepID=UPI00333787E9